MKSSAIPYYFQIFLPSTQLLSLVNVVYNLKGDKIKAEAIDKGILKSTVTDFSEELNNDDNNLKMAPRGDGWIYVITWYLTDWYNTSGGGSGYYTSTTMDGYSSEWVYQGPYGDPSDNPVQHEHRDEPYYNGGGGGVSNNHPVEILKDPSFIGTKPECVYDKLEEGSTSFKEAIKNFDGEFPVAHLKFSVDYNLPDTTNAATNNSEDNYILIKINGNTLGDRTTLGLARTLAHEVIHAELYRKVRSVGGQVSLNDFPGIYDYYRRYVKNWQHEQMASHYREVIVDILKEFDNDQQSYPLYNNLAWEGLTNTVAWDQLSTTEKTTITNSIINFKNTGNKNCN